MQVRDPSDWDRLRNNRHVDETFPNAATLAQKKQLISEFIEHEKDRKVVKTCEEFFKGQLITLELKIDMMDFDGITLIKLLKHLRDEYALQSAECLEKVLSEFEEPPDLTKPN